MNLAQELGEDAYLSDSDDEEVLEVKPEEVQEYRDFPVPVVSVNLTLDAGVPLGALIVSDPVTQFLESLPPEERKKVIVVKDSESLHTIWLLIHGHSKQESISDVGSQIVAMAKHIRDPLGSRFKNKNAKCKWSG